MIRGITYDKQFFKSSDFALMTKRFFRNNDGIVYGCDITNTANTVVISKGYFATSGYYTCLSSAEVVQISKGGTLVYEIDLGKVNTDTRFEQGSFKVIDGNPVKSDLFADGLIYQYPIARFNFTNNAISNFVVLASKVFGDENVVRKGTQPPDNSVGTDGDEYLQYFN